MADRQDMGQNKGSAGAHKGTVSRATTSSVKKTQPGKGGASGSRSASGSRPVSGNRPASGSHLSSASRPKSATAQDKRRTSTGRPLEKSVKSVSSGSKTRRPANSRSSTGSGKKSAQSRNKKKRYELNTKMMVVAALVVGIVLALVITMIMRSSMLRVKQIQTDYNMGDIFDITNYIEPDSNDARLEYDNSEFAPDKLGKYTIKYKIGRGKLSKTKKTVINVVDEVNPYIDGPDEIDVSVGTDINWSDYYNVTDEDPDVQDSLKASQDVDTSKERTVTVTLTAEDWAGNKASRQITVNVLKSNFDE